LICGFEGVPEKVYLDWLLGGEKNP
jgi:hypothetical protein